MKNVFLFFCIAFLLATASPGYGAFLPASKVFALPAKGNGKMEVQPVLNGVFTPLQTGREAQKRLGFWKRLKIKVLRLLLPTDRETQLTALLLGIFLGLFGIHRFYLGYNDQGLLYVLITLSWAALLLFAASAALLAGSAVSYAFLKLTLYIMLPLTIWLIIDLIRIAAGTLRPLK